MAKDKTTKTLAEQHPLTAYETGQVAQIAAWKSESPGVAKRLLRNVTGPLGSLVNKVLPKGAVQSAMDGVNKMAGQLARDDSILKDPKLKAQGIASLEDIAARPLEFADALADHIIHDAGNIALGMGAATGTGGPIAAVAGLPVLVAGALRVIYRVSQAYGYALDHPGAKELMLHILALSTATGPDERAQAMANYQRQIETTFLHQAMEESANNALQRAVLGAELGSLIPGFSIAFSAYLNREFVHRAGIAAKRVFQEHWLRNRDKVTWINPA
ncbi:hypothetical protein MTYM_02119 [Methylococcales bacterium]|nr:hypothetical protein MTYM_02119 [Methylococcales bacterium]